MGNPEITMKRHTMKAWAGFSEGRPHESFVDDRWGGKHLRPSLAIFLSRKEAIEQYEDAREIEISWSGK